MELDITKHGDILEVTYSKLILERLPAYAEIWKRFIGNTGQGRMIDVNGLDKKEQQRRTLFSQYHYSCFESIVAMKHLIQEISSTEVQCINQCIKEYLRVNNAFLCFQAHAGRIRDGVKKMGKFFQIPNLDKDFNEYYQQRNVVLHGCKIPYMIIDGILAIPPIKGEEENAECWNSNRTWPEMNPDDFQFLPEYVSATFEGILEKLNSALYKLLPKIKETVAQLKIELELKEDEHFKYSPTTSGIMENHVFNIVRFQNKSGSLP